MVAKGRGRHTFQRQVILEELTNCKGHPRAEELFERVRKRIPTISRGTVYRNLKLFRDEGLAQELTMGKEASRWEGNIRPHYHFTCEVCDRVWDLPVPVERDLERRLRREMGFRISAHRLEFYGFCKECSSKANVPGRPGERVR